MTQEEKSVILDLKLIVADQQLMIYRLQRRLFELEAECSQKSSTTKSQKAKTQD